MKPESPVIGYPGFPYNIGSTWLTFIVNHNVSLCFTDSSQKLQQGLQLTSTGRFTFE